MKHQIPINSNGFPYQHTQVYQMNSESPMIIPKFADQRTSSAFNGEIKSTYTLDFNSETPYNFSPQARTLFNKPFGYVESKHNEDLTEKTSKHDLINSNSDILKKISENLAELQKNNQIMINNLK